MSKFGKRITKFIGPVENCLVIGEGFGKLSEICEIFSTVFVFDDKFPSYKSKNLIYRENHSYLDSISGINVIFFDRNSLDKMHLTIPIWYRQKPYIIIEGNDVIERDLSQDLYKHGYRAVELQGTHHIWKPQ